MCITATALAFGGGLLQTASSLMYASTQAEMAKADAAAERDAAQQQAEKIMRATQRRRGEARAATAASGAKIDQFALGVEQEILQAGETDAAMAILSGERKARGLETSAKLQRASGFMSAGESLFSTAYGMRGWSGAKYTGTNDFSGVTGRNAMDTWLRYGKGGD